MIVGHGHRHRVIMVVRARCIGRVEIGIVSYRVHTFETLFSCEHGTEQPLSANVTAIATTRGARSNCSSRPGSTRQTHRVVMEHNPIEITQFVFAKTYFHRYFHAH